MSPNTVECLDPQAFENTQASELVRMRLDVIMRARREIVAGRYDDDATVLQMLAGCMDDIVEDVREA